MFLLDLNAIAFRKRTSTDKTDKIAASMKKNGWTDRPILVYADTRNIYIALTGTHRVRAAWRAGLKEIPAVIIRCAEDNFTKLFEARDDKERACIACELYYNIINIRKPLGRENMAHNARSVGAHVRRSCEKEKGKRARSSRK